MKKTNIQMMVLIAVTAVIVVVFSVPLISSVMGVLIAEIGLLPVIGIFIGFAGIFYGTQKICDVLSHTKYRYWI